MKHLNSCPDKGSDLVNEGFCWPAAIFGSLWAMAHRMWFPHVLALLPAEAMLWFLTAYLQTPSNDDLLPVIVIANLAFFLVCGLYGNAWLAESLCRHGFSKRDDLLPAAAKANRTSERPVAG